MQAQQKPAVRRVALGQLERGGGLRDTAQRR